jgi:predicted transglutaminase-like cysteine proteinase
MLSSKLPDSSDTGYRFFKRQSQSNPNVWVSLSDPQPATATATSR